MLKPVFLILPIIAILILACATPVPAPTDTAVPTATPDIPATVESRVAAVLTQTAYPTNTPYPTALRWPTSTPRPTYTLYPTPTPLPTLTPWPTYTPYPTATPRPTYTPFPTLTPTPQPTATPNATPAPDTKWGLTYQPISIKDAVCRHHIKSGTFILHGCYTGIGRKSIFGEYRTSKSFTFTEDGGSNPKSIYAEVIGFHTNAFLQPTRCYEMAVKYRTIINYCYYSFKPGQPPPHFTDCSGHSYWTPIY